MKKALLPLVILALALSASAADGPERESFPSDYKPSPCAPDPMAVCDSFPQTQIVDYGTTFRGFSMHQEWVDAHWDSMREAFRPICAKIATCYATPGNDDVYCVDTMRAEFLATCNRFPVGSDDRDQCRMFALTYFMGLGTKAQLYKPAQKCAKEQAVAGPKKLEAWIEPGTLPVDFRGKLFVHAIDAETRVPLRAKVSIDSGKVQGTEGPFPTAGYEINYKAHLKRVPNAQGHRDVIAPTVTVEMKGYETLQFPLPIALPKMTAKMEPAALVPGTNTITVHVVDAETGKPVFARVMAGDRPLGQANKPLTLEWRSGEKRPEIWVTSLYDHYDDVVVLEGE